MRYPPLADNRGSSDEPKDENLRSLITWSRLIVSLRLYFYQPAAAHSRRALLKIENAADPPYLGQ